MEAINAINAIVTAGNVKIGKIVEVSGPVVDVEFEHGHLPKIKEALTVSVDGKERVMEVAQHVGKDTVRCIMLAESESLARGMAVRADGRGIRVPVGSCTLGRMFNVLGEPIDGGPDVSKETKKWEIHRKAPAFAQQRPVVEILETGIKNRPVRRGRCRENGSDPGADPQCGNGAWRLFDFYRSRRTEQGRQ